ncbi:Coq4 family protein [Sphingomonas sp. C3-2]|uniref:Coq4 family protein n=1 Tax=Sphingomonas sp. C3-2 TaxID=3062169 RepID=UPI00294B4057|nr:Coq4 family protein [Sphingomonas sp. C3-2]WOK35434.1 Coq4 family protein [Sphingomonas sp. C3-2]
MSNVSQADFEYFNGAITKHETESSVLISSSRYLNHGPLRALIAQEFLRKNGADMPNTAFIPEVAQILHQLEDVPAIEQMIQEEAERLPEFRAWLDRRLLSDFKAEEVKDSKPGTLGAVIYDFIANSGYNMDYFFQGMQVRSDYEYYLKERTLTHDIEHMVTGFETNFCGEIALLEANFRGFCNYFKPELAAVFMRVPTYLKSKSIMKAGLHYPKALVEMHKAMDIGAAQGNSWKKPLTLLPWRDMVDWKIEDIREEYGITGAPPSGYWDWTNAIAEDPRPSHGIHAMAAE